MVLIQWLLKALFLLADLELSHWMKGPGSLCGGKCHDVMSQCVMLRLDVAWLIWIEFEETLVDSLNSTMTQLLCQRKEHLERFISLLSLSTTQKFIITWLQMSHWQLQYLLMSCFHFSGFFGSFILCRFPLKL